MKNSVVFNFLIKRNILNIKENLKHTEKERMPETRRKTDNNQTAFDT